MKRTWIIFVVLLIIVGSVLYFSTKKNPDIHQLVSVGMCPNDIIKKIGNPYFFEARLDETVWPGQTDPQIAIMKQCEKPDKSTFKLFFDTGTKWVISFENGKAIAIDHVNK